MVNPVPVDEAAGWVRNLATALLNPSDDEFQYWLENFERNWHAERSWGYRENGRWVATLATQPRHITVPGPHGGTSDIEVDALTGVSVAATHRRRGLLTSMISESLRTAKERGEPFSILVAAEWPIYGRFGYAPAVDGAVYRYYPRRPSAALPAPPAGATRQVDPEEVAKVAGGIFETARRLRPGQVDRRDPWWTRRLSLDGYRAAKNFRTWVLHDGPDGPDGILCTHVARDFGLGGNLGALEVDEFIAANDTAYRDLWAYLGGIDVIEEITLHNRPVDESARWLMVDGRALVTAEVFDFVWVRLLDVPAALSARSYAIPGRVVLEVVDEGLGGYGAGRFLLEADDSGARCEMTSDRPDLRIEQRALAACYLGGHRLAGIPGVEELTSGALQRADLMFSVPRAPWNQTGF
jgi:predicted acetyltransferase